MAAMRVYVASDDPAAGYQLRELLLNSGHECPTSQAVSLDRITPLLESAGQAATATAEPSAPNRDPQTTLVLLILPADVERALATLRELRRRAPSHQLFVIGPTNDSKLVLRVIREGAQEYLDQAELSTELAAALERLWAEQSGALAHRAITLLAPSGGAGCSTLAANIATVLAGQKGQCVLLDLEPLFGDLAALLDLKPDHTLADLARENLRIDRSLFDRALVSHASGLRLLAAPGQIDDAPQVTADTIGQVLSLASSMARYVISDSGHSFLGTASQALPHADQILVVLRLDFTSLRNTRRVLDQLDRLGIARQQLRIVANRYGRPGELAASEAEQALQCSISQCIIEDPKNVNRANNQGMPVVQYAPSSKVARQITELALSLVPQS